MMKRMFIALVVVALLFATSGCAVSNVDTHADTKEAVTKVTTLKGFEMELVGGSVEERFSYYRDTVTDTMFVFCRSSTINTQGGGLTLMLDPETGLPLTYARYMEIYNNLEAEE